MSDDDDGIIGEIAEAVGGVAGAMADELKKFGKSATSQVTGSGSISTSTTKQKPSVSGNGDDAGSGVVGEFKKLVQTAGSQVTGQAPTLEVGDLAKMAKKDEEFSTHEAAAVRARINQIYQEYAAKRAREQQQKTLDEQKREQEKVELTEIGEKKKQEEMDVSVAQAKAKAEIKNYGAE